MSLADSGDEVILRDKNDDDIDAVVYEGKIYGNINPHPGITRPNSLERQPKGKDTDDCSIDFIEQINPSPFLGLPSAIKLKLLAIGGNYAEITWDENLDSDFKNYKIFESKDGITWQEIERIDDSKIVGWKIENLSPGTKYYFRVRNENQEGSYFESNMVTVLTKIVYSSKILINELLPHPSTGTDNEYIELYNDSSEDINLSGWFLDDSEGGSSPYSIPIGTIIKANSYLVFNKKETKLALNDDGDVARLFWPDNTLISFSEMYKKADYDLSWSRNIDSSWNFSTTVTPGETNIFTIKEEENINIPVVPIEDAKNKPKNEWVKVEGVVTAIPGLFGKRVLYIQDNSGGIKVYFDKALWPQLKVGDKVIIFGKISTSLGEYQIKVYSPDDIIVIGHDSPPESKDKEIIEIKGYIGSLIKVSGKVVKISGSTIWIDDNTGELRIYFYPAAGIKSLGLDEGDWVIVVGILSKTSAGLRLLPRSKNDIIIVKNDKKVAQIEENSLTSQILGIEKAQAASDYRSDGKQNNIQAKNNLKLAVIIITLISLFLLASLIIFARIREKHAKYN